MAERPSSRPEKRPHASGDDDEDSDDRESLGLGGQEQSRASHNQIEKRRREKMNCYIKELESMIPSCLSSNKKLDKLTVLKLAVQHLRELRGNPSDDEESPHQKPTFLSDDELKYLILEAADGFLFVVGCELGKVLYVSDSVLPLLQQEQNDWVGQRFQDIVHPGDVAKVQEQLAVNGPSIESQECLAPDPKRGISLSGTRRSFFCRVQCGEGSQEEEQQLYLPSGNTSENALSPFSNGEEEKQHYAVVHVTGYIKTWDVTPENAEVLEDLEGNRTCLVAIARCQAMGRGHQEEQLFGATEFMSRHTLDGKFSFVDQRVADVIGYVPQELIGSSFYEFYHRDDVPRLAEDHKALLSGLEDVLESKYRFRSKSGQWIWLRSRRFGFRNPWTGDIDYIVSQNILASRDEPGVFPSLTAIIHEKTALTSLPSSVSSLGSPALLPASSSAVFSNHSSPADSSSLNSAAAHQPPSSAPTPSRLHSRHEVQSQPQNQPRLLQQHTQQQQQQQQQPQPQQQQQQQQPRLAVKSPASSSSSSLSSCLLPSSQIPVASQDQRFRYVDPSKQRHPQQPLPSPQMLTGQVLSQQPFHTAPRSQLPSQQQQQNLAVSGIAMQSFPLSHSPMPLGQPSQRISGFPQIFEPQLHQLPARPHHLPHHQPHPHPLGSCAPPKQQPSIMTGQVPSQCLSDPFHLSMSQAAYQAQMQTALSQQQQHHYLPHHQYQHPQQHQQLGMVGGFNQPPLSWDHEDSSSMASSFLLSNLIEPQADLSQQSAISLVNPGGNGIPHQMRRS